jgi:hypothetical protein
MLGIGVACAAAATRSTAVSIDFSASARSPAGLGGSMWLGPFAGVGVTTGVNGAVGASVAPDARKERLPLVSMISALSFNMANFASHNVIGKRTLSGSQAELCVAQDD